jgi:hypothetical protein
MFSTILKIVPKLDQATLRKMEQTLTSRFKKVAKSFGKGIANIFKGGGLAGVLLGLIDKILNPLQETKEAIDRMLNSSDDLATNAQQFNTSTGKLTKLVQLAKATGLDQDNLFQLLSKFQGAVAEASADPNAPSAVRNFMGEDTAEEFFNFIQSLQKMEKNQQRLVQENVFGEKQVLKMADFLQQDFPKLLAATGLDKIQAAKLGASIDKMAGLKDLEDILSVRRETQDFQTKGSMINESMIRQRDASARLELEKENSRIKSYNDLATISDTTTKIFGLIETGVAMIGKFIGFITPAVNSVVESLQKFAKSPLVRGFFKGKDD